MPDETSERPAAPDQDPAGAHRQESDPGSSPSVLARIGDAIGSRPRVTLRDHLAGESPAVEPRDRTDSHAAGKYVVQAELGRGGVGTVHRGHDQDLGRDVAMKFLHEKYKDHPDILHRFVEEAQIGGQLQHPGIVPVYDLGMVEGRTFFSMKLVEGRTLAHELARRSSPADGRGAMLAIFEDICQTLAYAHARGVVHRDLKPANIMIGSFGEVQVVDWGMGKVLPTGSSDRSPSDQGAGAAERGEVSMVETVRSAGHGTQSIMGSVMGTPAYMPPEQANGDVEAMDERSDVFALGAILCEILSGQPPYVGEPEELIAMAAMAELDDAYARLEASGGDPEMIALAKSCLQSAPADRPRSAEVVAKAVHDHLAAVESRVHEARVEAAEAKVRAASLKRTQRLGIGLTVVIAVGLGVSLWFWRAADTAATNEGIAREEAVASAREARLNEQLAIEQTEAAERELARAVEIKTLITEMLQSVDPEFAQGADVSLLEGILDVASERLADGAIEDDAVAAELHALIGSVYRSIGLYPEAEGHLPVALELRQDLFGPEHPITLDSMSNLALLYRAQARSDEAEALVLRVLEAQRRDLGERHPSTLRSMGNLATVYDQQGRYEDAESLNLEVWEARNSVLGEEHPNTLSVRSRLALNYLNQGRYDEAEPLFLETLEIEKRVLGDQHPGTLVTLGNLAIVYDRQGRLAESAPLHLQMLENSRRTLGEEHPNTLGATTNLGLTYNALGRFEDAADLLEISLPIKRRVLGLDHPWTQYALEGLLKSYSGLGRTEDALPLQRELLDLQVTAADAAGASTQVLYDAAKALLTHEVESLRDPARALGYADRACALAMQADSPYVWRFLVLLALSQFQVGDVDAAVATQRRALALMPEGADPGVAERLAEYESYAE